MEISPNLLLMSLIIEVFTHLHYPILAATNDFSLPSISHLNMSTTSNHFTFNTLGPPGSNRNSTGIASVGGYKRSPTGIDGNKLSSSLFEMSPKSVLLACKHHTNLI